MRLALAARRPPRTERKQTGRLVRSADGEARLAHDPLRSDDDRIYSDPTPRPPSRHGSDGGGNRVPQIFLVCPATVRCGTGTTCLAGLPARPSAALHAPQAGLRDSVGLHPSGIAMGRVLWRIAGVCCHGLRPAPSGSALEAWPFLRRFPGATAGVAAAGYVCGGGQEAARRVAGLLGRRCGGFKRPWSTAAWRAACALRACPRQRPAARRRRRA